MEPEQAEAAGLNLGTGHKKKLVDGNGSNRSTAEVRLVQGAIVPSDSAVLRALQAEVKWEE